MIINDKNGNPIKVTPALYLAAQDKKLPLQLITDLSLKDAVYLITLIRSAEIVGRDGHVGSIIDVPTLAPDHLESFLYYLVQRKLIKTSIQTEVSAFNVLDGEVIELDYQAAKWKIYLDNFESTLLELNNVIENSNWPPFWRHDVKAVWLEIAILECSDFLIYLAYKREFEIAITDEITF
jgi:hypothetical protein